MADLAYSLIIGVIGGASVDSSAPWLRQAVRQALGKAQKALPPLPHTPVRLCILTNLTGGLDALVVEEARHLDPLTQVRVILPMLREDCQRLLPAHLPAQRFQALLACDPHPLALRRELLARHYHDEHHDQAHRRARVRAEEFVIEHSDLVLALPAPQAAGHPGAIPHAEKAGCPLIILREGGDDSPISIADHGHAGELQKHMEAFNAGLAANPVADEHLRPKAQSLADPASGLLDQPWAEFLFHRLSPVYAYADKRAGFFQTLYRSVGLLVYVLAFVATLLVGIGGSFLDGPAYVYAIEALLLVAITILIRYANQVGSHRQWLAYRFLAERLRAAFFLGLGRQHPKEFYVPRRKNVEIDPAAWAHLVVDAVYSEAPAPGVVDSGRYQALGDFIKAAWVEDQLKFHLSREKRDGIWGHRLERWGEWVFWLALAGAATHWLLHFLHLDLAGPHLANGLTLGASVLPSLGATLGAMRSHREFKRNEARSQQMARTLKGLLRSFDLLTPGKLQYLLDKMEALSLAEAENWKQLMDAATLEKA